MQIQAADVIKLTNDIWASMLGMELAPCDHVEFPGAEQVLAASVEVMGDWQGRIRLDCSSRLAREAAARFVGADPAEITSEQVCDALAELTNMTAGSVKALLPCASRLTIPGMDASALPAPTRSDMWLQSGFTYEGEPLLVTIVQQSGSSSSSREPVTQ
ncbi:MAG: chemotaxis protein CheX [Terriglobales bacterium]